MHETYIFCNRLSPILLMNNTDYPGSIPKSASSSGDASSCGHCRRQPPHCHQYRCLHHPRVDYRDANTISKRVNAEVDTYLFEGEKFQSTRQECLAGTRTPPAPAPLAKEITSPWRSHSPNDYTPVGHTGGGWNSDVFTEPRGDEEKNMDG